MTRPQRTGPFPINGMWFRIVPEELAHSPLRKGKDHMVLQWWRAAGTYPDGAPQPAAWLEVKMDTGFLMADFFFNEEHAMFNREHGFRGGYKYMDALWQAARKGWQYAALVLCAERMQKAQRKEGGDSDGELSSL
jgi:hypothetical protein